MSNRQLKIYIFYCSNSLEKEQVSGLSAGIKGIEVKEIGLPCSGKIDIPYMLKAFETGADGAVIVTCRQGECRHMEGNLRAQKRAQAAGELLAEIGLEKERITVVMQTAEGAAGAAEGVKNFIEGIAGMETVKIAESTKI